MKRLEEEGDPTFSEQDTTMNNKNQNNTTKNIPLNHDNNQIYRHNNPTTATNVLKLNRVASCRQSPSPENECCPRTTSRGFLQLLRLKELLQKKTKKRTTTTFLRRKLKAFDSNKKKYRKSKTMNGQELYEDSSPEREELSPWESNLNQEVFKYDLQKRRPSAFADQFDEFVYKSQHMAHSSEVENGGILLVIFHSWIPEFHQCWSSTAAVPPNSIVHKPRKLSSSSPRSKSPPANNSPDLLDKA
ncbi:unnamed protein product [Lepeophtheirus salmonis]|uniref:(salmon louse) hypothetical protein n=1 Tax=Lepeophtheirus salmonis TaxID=72036 RepID=A0A7R8CQP8_LEPSM|nr:unnamed protein product [Lepeophtheirus salmonis]CAF2860828.1 unnamed protein product [Lepeophtheirus salmonis]